jgi:quinol monooxygenase YgiN
MLVVLGSAMLFFMFHAKLEAQNLYGAIAGESVATQLNNYEIVVRLIRYEVKPRHRVPFRKLVKDYVRHSLNQKVNILSEAYFEQEEPSVLWIIERWANRNELEMISRKPKFKLIESASRKVLIEPAQIIYAKDLEPISKQLWRRRAEKRDKPITIMLFVDTRDGTENDFKSIYHGAMPEFRSEPGVINYQLSQLDHDQTQFVTYEKFRDESAFQYHLNFPPIKPVIDYLNTSIEKPPFQNGIHRLIKFGP